MAEVMHGGAIGQASDRFAVNGKRLGLQCSLNGTNRDTDEDGLGDGYEVAALGSSPRFNDTDRDGLWDGNFSWYGGHSVNRTVGEFLNRTNISNPDTDGDGMPDGWELYYYLNASDAGDAFSDNDLDWFDAWEEYEWDLPENYSLFTNGTVWNGTDPTDLDTDDDTMPDGYETYWGLDPKNASDADIHSDGDLIKNKDEYNWSIVNASWDTPHAAWYVWLTLDPFSNDTDGDNLTDGFEMNRSVRDYDGDQESNGVDIDSDNDELWDDEEVMGWNVSILPAWILRANLSDYQNATGDIDWSKFPLWANTSDPYDADTDNDSLTPDEREFLDYFSMLDRVRLFVQAAARGESV